MPWYSPKKKKKKKISPHLVNHNLLSELASWTFTQDLCVEGSALGCLFCLCLLKILHQYWTQGPTLSLCPGPGRIYSQSCHQPTPPLVPLTYVMTPKGSLLLALGFTLMGLFYACSLLSLPPQCGMMEFFHWRATSSPASIPISSSP